MDLISEGAEAKIYLVSEGLLKKVRLPKKYRIEKLDKKLRKSRTRREFKVLTKLSENGVAVPKPFEIFENDFSFTFEKLEGEVLMKCLTEKLLFDALKIIIDIHKLDIVHGDLTTLNMISTENGIFLIDFGLSEFNSRIEDKAVDLNLFFNCIKNEHPSFYHLKDKLEKEYIKLDFGSKVIDRLRNVEKRGRNRN